MNLKYFGSQMLRMRFNNLFKGKKMKNNYRLYKMKIKKKNNMWIQIKIIL